MKTQIALANKQIGLANDQIALAKEQISQQSKALETALTDLTISSHLSAVVDEDRARIPNLQVRIEYKTLADSPDDRGSRLRLIQIYVVNSGTASANNIEVNLRFPATAIVQSQGELIEYLGELPDRRKVFEYIELAPTQDGSGMQEATVYDRDLELLSGQEPWQIARGWFLALPGPIEVLWRVRCRQGKYPEGERGAYTLIFD